jgi:hypothetical protein
MLVNILTWSNLLKQLFYFASLFVSVLPVNSVERSRHWRWPRRHKSYSCSFNHSKMVDVQTTEVDAKLSPVNVGLRNLYGDWSSECKHFKWDHFCGKQIIRILRAVEIKFHILSYGNTRTAGLRQPKFGSMEVNEHTYMFYLNNYFL